MKIKIGSMSKYRAPQKYEHHDPYGSSPFEDEKFPEIDSILIFVLLVSILCVIAVLSIAN